MESMGQTGYEEKIKRWTNRKVREHGMPFGIDGAEDRVFDTIRQLLRDGGNCYVAGADGVIEFIAFGECYRAVAGVPFASRVRPMVPEEPYPLKSNGTPRRE